MDIQNKAKTLLEFIKFCKSVIGIQKLPKIQFIKDNKWSQQNKSFGQYNSELCSIVIYIGDRHIVDCMRTLAHEMTHHKQNELGLLKPDSGQTGSEIENQANEIAGIIMRKFGELHQNIYE
jgi:Zn-dependent peptidase ImmA (M78 family)